MASFEDILRELDGDMAALQSAFDKFMSDKKAEKVEEPKKVGRKPKTEDKEGDKRMTRVTPSMAKDLEAALTSAGISCDDEKAFKKLKDEFRGYVNELTDDDYKKSSLTDHMRDFANLKKEVKVEEVAEAEKPKKAGRKPKAEKKVEADAEPEKKGEAEAEPEKKPKKGGRKKAEKKPEKEEAVANAKGGGAATVAPVILTYTALMERSEDLYTDQQVGLFWDPKAGEMVTGPVEDADEDMEEVKFEDKTYAVGEKTGRVYAQDDEGLDIFVGFRGAPGKFKHM